MDFSDILASSIHDIKNSLCLILNNLDDLISNPENHLADPRQARLLQHEAQRANSSLIQLLTLYRLGNEQLVLRVSEQNLEDFFDEVVAESQAISQALNITISYRCDPSLIGYFDTDLVRGVLDSTIGNAYRYANSQILLSAEKDDDYLVIRVEDDGAGFANEDLPQWTTDGTIPAQDADNPRRTRLGLYFASQIAQLHTAADKTGRVRLRNAHTLPGGCFELWLP